MSAHRTRASSRTLRCIGAAAMMLATTVHTANAQVEVGDRAPAIRFNDLKGLEVDLSLIHI